MKAPSVAPNTASQVLEETAGAAWFGARVLFAGDTGELVCAADRGLERGHDLPPQPPFDSREREIGCQPFAASRSASTVALVLTVGSADMPGRSRPLSL